MADLKLGIERYDSQSTLATKAEILPVYAAAHHDLQHNPWFHPDQFWRRLVDLYAPGQDFELVAGRLDGQVVGYAFGSPRFGDDELWQKSRDTFPGLELPAEPQPIYIFREFAVHPEQQRQGVGRQLHDALLEPRPEPLASLLVRKDNEPAQAAYRAWGWRRLGDQQPFPDSPVFDQLVLGMAVNRRQPS